MAKQPTDKHLIEVVEESPNLPIHFVNQFRAEVSDNIVEVYLAANFSGHNVTNLLLVIPVVALNSNRETVARYHEDLLNSTTNMTTAQETARLASSTPTVYYGNLLDFSRFGDLAQIRLCFFSIRKLVGVEPGARIRGWPVCAINMTTDVQLGIIKKLYFGDHK
jgi:hypothetical protein